MNDTEKHRISRVTTRSGDSGTTGLADGSRLSKADRRILAMGDLDELNSALGVLRSRALPDALDKILDRVQHALFDMGAELAIPGHTVIQASHVLYLEQQQDELNATLPALKEFLLPGGHADAAWCHYCRTLARRVERQCVALHDAQTGALPAESLRYINRLSDLLFVMARSLNQHHGVSEPLWNNTVTRNGEQHD